MSGRPTTTARLAAIAGTSGRNRALLVGGLTLVGALLRLPSFRDSLFGDEISTYYVVAGHSLGRVLKLVHSNQETSPPGYFVLTWAVNRVLADPLASARLISLFAGIAVIPLTYVVGVRTVGRRAALLGTALVAVAPYMIFFSTESRPFVLALFFVFLSTAVLLQALDTGRWSWWTAYAVTSCAAAYCHYTVVFLLVIQVCWALLARPGAWKGLLAANVGAGIAYIPWLGGLHEDLSAPNRVVGSLPFSIEVVKGIWEQWWIGHPVIAVSHLPGHVLEAIAGVGILLALVGVGLRMGEIPRSRSAVWSRIRAVVTSRTALVVMLGLGSPILVAAYSALKYSILGGNTIVASWPYLALSIGALIARSGTALRIVAGCLVLIPYCVGGIRLLSPGTQRPDAAGAVAFIDREAGPGDPIVSLPTFANPLSELDVALAQAERSNTYPVIRLDTPPLSAHLHFLRGPHPRAVFFGLPIESPQGVAADAVRLARHRRIFVVGSGPIELALYFPSSPPAEFLNALPKSFRVVEHRTFPGFSGLVPITVSVVRQ